jgi:hypothetical protein
MAVIGRSKFRKFLDAAASELRPPDAHDCIVVAILTGRPTTSPWRAVSAPDGQPPSVSSPLSILNRRSNGMPDCRDRASRTLCRRLSVAARRPSVTLDGRCAWWPNQKNRSVRGDDEGWSNKEMADRNSLNTHRPIQVLWTISEVAVLCWSFGLRGRVGLAPAVTPTHLAESGSAICSKERPSASTPKRASARAAASISSAATRYPPTSGQGTRNADRAFVTQPSGWQPAVVGRTDAADLAGSNCGMTHWNALASSLLPAVQL